MDSHVLLHCMAILAREQPYTVRAIHINHGLSQNANDWEAHCTRVCHNLSIDIILRQVTVSAPGEGPESAARRARYAAITRELGEGQVLLTAHHRRDQVETFILQLMRGSGTPGLAAMSMLRSLPPGWLLRPFLHMDQSILLDYAEKQQLRWVCDPSNEDTHYNRNYVRHRVLPVLRQRWPAAEEVIERCSRHLSEAAELADMLAKHDLEGAQVGDIHALDLSAYVTLPIIRRKNLLRFWIKNYCGTVPPATELEQISHVLAEAGQDANPLMEWNNIQIRRYRDRAYILPALPPVPGSLQLEWDMQAPLQLPLGILKTDSEAGVSVAGKQVTVSFRSGGERIRPAGRGHTHTVKKLLQEAGIPPWLRDYLPMLHIDGKLVLVPGVCLTDELSSDLSRNLSGIVWELPDDILPGHFSTFKTDTLAK